jgi:hypothetical protein
MKYETPTVVAIGSALACVQIANKQVPNVFDIDSRHTSNAYEADE